MVHAQANDVGNHIEIRPPLLNGARAGIRYVFVIYPAELPA